MRVKESESSGYVCCMADRNCKGKRCMAWQWVSKVVRYVNDDRPTGSIIPPRPKEPVFECTEYGYCGMLKE